VQGLRHAAWQPNNHHSAEYRQGNAEPFEPLELALFKLLGLGRQGHAALRAVCLRLRGLMLAVKALRHKQSSDLLPVADVGLLEFLQALRVENADQTTVLADDVLIGQAADDARERLGLNRQMTGNQLLSHRQFKAADGGL